MFHVEQLRTDATIGLCLILTPFYVGVLAKHLPHLL